MSLQLFVWCGPPQRRQDGRLHYQSFSLNNQTYHVGDCVYLYPEEESYPHYIARILAAFVDSVDGSADPHCIEVKWFERRVNLEPSTKGIEESEREVFELEDTDINPIGCISGKCRIVRAANYDEARRRCGGTPGWYFCRGYFQQSSNSFVPYTEEEMAVPEAPQRPDALDDPPVVMPGIAPGPPRPNGLTQYPQPQGRAASGGRAAGSRGTAGGGAGRGRGGSRHGADAAGWGPGGDEDEEDGAQESDDPSGQDQLYVPGPQPPQQQLPPNKRQKATGRVCVECGATQTPQWREGPQGPKTLCNACGVRYVRSQQRAAGVKRSSGGQKNGQGRSQELTPPRAQQQGGRGSRRGTSPKAYPSAPQTSADTGVVVP